MEIWKRFGLIFFITFSLGSICLVWLSAPLRLSYAAAPLEPSQAVNRLPDGLATVTSTVVFLPLIANDQACPTTSANSYALIQLLEDSPRPVFPEQMHADLNLAYRGYEPVTEAALALLVDPPVQNWPYSTTKPLNAPKLSTLFNANPFPAIVSTDQIYDWDWSQPNGGSRAGLLDNWETTLIGLDNSLGTAVYLPNRAVEIYTGGYNALVLYADETQLTVTYEHTDSVAIGYSLHLENLCVDPNLLALYRAQIAPDGTRASELLPGLRSGQPIGTSRGGPLQVATRYYGNFMDPRSANVWWSDQLGNVTGIVFNQAFGEPLTGIEVRAYQNQNGDWQEVAVTDTDENGEYVLALPGGVYRIGFSDPNGFYQDTYYDDFAYELETADDVLVTAGATTSGINAYLLIQEIIITTTDDDRTDNGNCTLREAIIAANTDTQVDACQAGNGPDTIQVPAGLYALYVPNNDEDEALGGDLDITDELTLIGDGASATVIDGSDLNDRIFHILNTSVKMSAMTIRNGHIAGPAEARSVLPPTEERPQLRSSARESPAEPSGRGGGILLAGGELMLFDTIIAANQSDYGGGGIFNQAGFLTLNSVTVISNSDNFGADESGGGIFNMSEATLNLVDSTIRGNRSQYGGGIDNFGTAVIQNSTVTENESASQGGGIWNGGETTIDDSAVDDNIASSVGGGIENQGQLTVRTSSVSRNTSLSDGAGLYNYLSGTVTIDNSDISDNIIFDSGFGAGIYNQGSLLLTDSLLDGNATTLSGGGIANFGDFTMDGTILSSNEATEDGGGLYNIGRASMMDSRLTGNTAFQGGGAENGFTGELDIMNSTIDANNAVGLLGQGGGVSSAGILSITNVTLSGNIAEDDGGALKIEAEAITYLLNATIADNEAHGAPGVGAGIFDLSGTAIIQIANTILDNNIGEDFYETPEPANCFANMSTEGFNLSSDSTCSSSLFHDFDRNNIDPLLDGLQLNAPGSTPTHALLPDSPAMDWIDSFSCPPPTTDQRGVSRPQSTACDSGAYEVEP